MNNSISPLQASEIAPQSELSNGSTMPLATLWSCHAVPIFNGQYDTQIDTGDNYHTRKLVDLWDLPPTGKPKAMAPAFIPSSYINFDARTHSVQRAHGRFVALTGDIDKGDVPLDVVIATASELFGHEAAIFIYSTGSATAQDKRWRVIVPIAEPVPFARWNEAQEAFFDFMDANGIPMDRALLRAAQPVYLPNVPPERRNADGEPLFYESYSNGVEGIPL